MGNLLQFSNSIYQMKGSGAQIWENGFHCAKQCKYRSGSDPGGGGVYSDVEMTWVCPWHDKKLAGAKTRFWHVGGATYGGGMTWYPDWNILFFTCAKYQVSRLNSLWDIGSTKFWWPFWNWRWHHLMPKI